MTLPAKNVALQQSCVGYLCCLPCPCQRQEHRRKFQNYRSAVGCGTASWEWHFPLSPFAWKGLSSKQRHFNCRRQNFFSFDLWKNMWLAHDGLATVSLSDLAQTSIPSQHPSFFAQKDRQNHETKCEWNMISQLPFHLCLFLCPSNLPSFLWQHPPKCWTTLEARCVSCCWKCKQSKHFFDNLLERSTLPRRYGSGTSSCSLTTDIFEKSSHAEEPRLFIINYSILLQFNIQSLPLKRGSSSRQGRSISRVALAQQVVQRSTITLNFKPSDIVTLRRLTEVRSQPGRKKVMSNQRLCFGHEQNKRRKCCQWPHWYGTCCPVHLLSGPSWNHPCNRRNRHLSQGYTVYQSISPKLKTSRKITQSLEQPELESLQKDGACTSIWIWFLCVKKCSESFHWEKEYSVNNRTTMAVLLVAYFWNIPHFIFKFHIQISYVYVYFIY